MGDNEKYIRSVKNKDLTFFALFKNYIIMQELFSVVHLIISLIISIGFVFTIEKYNLYEFNKSIFSSITSASTDVFGVLIAAFGLFAVITDLSFSVKIFKVGQLGNILFPFWFCSFLWVVNLIGSMFFSSIFDINGINMFSKKSITFFIIFLFTLTIGYTLALIGDILKLTIYRVQMETINDKSIEVSDYDENKIDEKLNQFFKALVFIYIIVLSYHFLWFYFLKEYWFTNLFSGALYFFTIYLSYKFYKKLSAKRQSLIIRKYKVVIKVMLLLFGFWFGVFLT